MSDDMQDEGRRRATEEEIRQAVPSTAGGKDARVGLFVIAGLLAFVTVLFWLTDPGTFRGRYVLVTTVSNAGGIRGGDPIQMYGVNLGRVRSFEMVGAGRIDITMEIEGEWSIPRGSRTVFGAAGIFGGRTLVIEPGTSPEMHQPGDTIPGEGPGGGGLLGSVDALGETAGTVLGRIQALLDEETVGSVQGSARELEGLLTELSSIAGEQRNTLGQLTESLTRSAGGLEQAAAAGPDVARMIARADSAMAVLESTSGNLDAAATSLRSVLARIDGGEGTLGRLSTDDALYVSLSAAAESLNALLLDLQANPKKYINISIF
jgi:phospholipid/cholesterol/gamma-HCH transport system substrate-binding protein